MRNNNQLKFLQDVQHSYAQGLQKSKVLQFTELLKKNADLISEVPPVIAPNEVKQRLKSMRKNIMVR